MMMLNAILEAIQAQGGGGGGGITEAQADARYLKLDTTNGPLTGVLGITVPTQTASAPVLATSTAWNNAGVTFRGVEFATSVTAAGANSTLLRLLSGAAGADSVFSVNSAGTITSMGTWNTPFGFTLQIAGTNILGGDGSQVSTNGVPLCTAFGQYFGFYNGGTGQRTTRLYEDTTGILALRNGATANSFRVYGDASNYVSVGHNGTDASIESSTGDIELNPNGGAAYVRFGSWNPDLTLVSDGYITIRDSGGALRKLVTAA